MKNPRSEIRGPKRARLAGAAANRRTGAVAVSPSLRFATSVLFALALLLTPGLRFPTAFAQSYSVDWSTVDGGGGTSTGGVYSVSGTIGQPDAGGPMTGGNYSLTGGFWSVVAAVQTPGAPRLTITRSGDSVMVSWPSPSTGFVLQQNTAVANPTGWSAFGGTINDNGTTRSVTLSAPMGNLFFRLKQ